MVKRMPRWTPGTQRGKAVAVSYNLPIKFILDGVTPMRGYSSDQLTKLNDSLIADRKVEVEKTLFDNENNSVNVDRDSEELTKYDVTNYVFSSSKLGYLNCDRFMRLRQPKVDLILATDDSNTNVKLIFHSMRSILSGYSRGNYCKFSNMPAGEKITVFAIRFIDKKPFVCFQELNISSEKVNLNFIELTKENLKKYTQEIDKI